MAFKNAQKRLIENPGYHISPKYDLTYFRRKRESEDGTRDFDVVLPLTSMIDMFSMLVIFLLLNFSATGEAYFVNKKITLPEALNARPLESLPLISVTRESVSLDADIVGQNPQVFNPQDSNMPGLVASLHRLKQLQDNLALGGIKPKTQINIQADQETPVVLIKRVMNILISEGFTGINFAVREGSDEQ